MKKKSIEERLLEDVINLFVNDLLEPVTSGKITEEGAGEVIETKKGIARPGEKG